MDSWSMSECLLGGLAIVAILGLFVAVLVFADTSVDLWPEWIPVAMVCGGIVLMFTGLLWMHKKASPEAKSLTVHGMAEAGVESVTFPSNYAVTVKVPSVDWCHHFKANGADWSQMITTPTNIQLGWRSDGVVVWRYANMERGR